MYIFNQKQYTTSEKETIRKCWLYTYFVTIFTFCLVMIEKAVRYPDILTYQSTIRVGNQLPQITYHPIPLLWIIFYACYLIGVTYLLYHFAYKKNGTKWLLGSLIWEALRLVKTLIQMIQFPREFGFALTNMEIKLLFLAICNVFFLLVLSYFIFISFRLYRLNVSLKNNAVDQNLFSQSKQTKVEGSDDQNAVFLRRKQEFKSF